MTKKIKKSFHLCKLTLKLFLTFLYSTLGAFTLTFAFPESAYVRYAQAAACPISDGGVGDGDGSVNQTITINSNTTWTATALNLGVFNCSGLTIRITSGATLTLDSYDSGDSLYTNDYSVYITADNITIDLGATISADGQGYAGGNAGADGVGPGAGDGTLNNGGGGGYGGAGGASTGLGINGAGGLTYGTQNAPTDLGSGGGGGTPSSGGAGGGSIQFSVSNTLTINGSLLARGAVGSCPGSVYCSGAGSGGSIYINTFTLSGSGSIIASGGNGAAAVDTGGNGGGGRIAIFLTDNNWLGNALTAAGAAPAGIGGNGGSAGTVFVDIGPNDPTSLTQYKSNGTTVIPTGDTTTETTVVLKASMSDPDNPETLTPEVEVREVGTSFSDTANYTGSAVSYTGTTVTGSVTLSSLASATSYHWQFRVCDTYSQCSEWISYGGNSESSIDFAVDTDPAAPTSLGPSSLTSGNYTSDDTPTLTFTLTDPDSSDEVKYRIQIDDSSDFSSPVVDYTSALGSQGSFSFTVGQSTSGGSYTVGSSGQNLSDAVSYYWRVKTIDEHDADSSYTTANSGNVAFIVDSTAPTKPGSLTMSPSSPTTDTTPTFDWSASSDSGSGLKDPAYEVEWCQNSSFSGCSSNIDTTNSTSYTLSDSLGDGTWYFRVSALDNAGNRSEYATKTFVIDTTGPRITSVSYTVSDTQIILTIETDEESTVEISYGGPSASGSASDSSFSTSHTFTLSGLVANSTYSIEIIATDSLTNKSEKKTLSITTLGSGAPPEEVVVPPEVINPQPTVPPVQKEPSMKEKLQVPIEKVKETLKTLTENKTVVAIGSIIQNAAKSAVASPVNTALLIATSILPVVPVAVSIFPYISFWNLPSLLAGLIRKKRHPWGIVYDSETKLPLDPVVLTLTNKSGKELQAVSDIYGRYEFLTEEGEYQLVANKTNYAFPSQKYTTPPSDEVYDDVFLGGGITLRKDTKFAYNVPMDAKGEDWNEREKIRMGYSKLNKMLYKISAVVFYGGFIASTVSLAFNPGLVQVLIVCGYSAVTIYRTYRVIKHPWGTIRSKKTNKPIGEAVVRLINVDIPKLKLPPLVTSYNGRYDFLIERGNYKVVVELKDAVSGQLKEVFRSGIIKITKEFGSIGEDIRI